MISLFSPAKINLFFKMIGLRKDGYHNLCSFFQAINLGDTLTFSRSSKDEFVSSDPILSFNNDNLIYRAVLLFRDATGANDPIKINLNKEIPIGAGLGGGSSNVATTLWGLNQLFETNLKDKTLAEMASKISSDAPFFFSQGSALVEGLGDVVKPAKMPESKKNVWLVKPPYSMSTPEVYLYSKKESKINKTNAELLDLVYTQSPCCANDLEDAAHLICPPLALLKDELEYQGYNPVFMTGSGSSYVCVGNERPNFKSPVQIFPIQYINRDSYQWYPRISYAIT